MVGDCRGLPGQAVGERSGTRAELNQRSGDIHLVPDQRQERVLLIGRLGIDQLLQQRNLLGALLELAELRQLRHEFLVIDRLERILVLELRHQQIQEVALSELLIGRQRRDGGRRCGG